MPFFGQGAEVEVFGKNWNEADELARSRVEARKGSAYVPPYDDARIWAGHSSVIDEVVKQMDGETPGALVVSVGGGGLLCGAIQGNMNHMSVGNAFLSHTGLHLPSQSYCSRAAARSPSECSGITISPAAEVRHHDVSDPSIPLAAMA